MKRVTMMFLVLAVSGGCMAVDPDPINDYPHGPPTRRLPATSQSQAPSQVGWGYGDSKPLQTSSSDWGSRSSAPNTNAPRSWGNPPQSTAVANKSSGSTTPATAAKSSAPKPVAAKKDKNDETLVKVSYTETKPMSEKPATKVNPPAEPEATPVNLGMLRLLSSKHIIIRYEVRDPASTGVADLEVWGTTDMRNWKKYDATTHSPSSLAVNVQSEGLYGFTVLARAKGDAVKNQPPQSDPPQLWVAVDLTKPVVQLLGAEMNVREKASALVIRWNATDRNLGPRPITLLYSERPEGPWTPIAANAVNNGHYEWIMPPCIPSSVCVRVQAADMMGNVGMAQTATIRIPGRTSVSSTPRPQPAPADSPCLDDTVPPPYPAASIHPISARGPKPTASILSVEGD